MPKWETKNFKDLLCRELQIANYIEIIKSFPIKNSQERCSLISLDGCHSFIFNFQKIKLISSLSHNFYKYLLLEIENYGLSFTNSRSRDLEVAQT